MFESGRPAETRVSLLERLRDPQDEEAWHEFVQLYTPVIFRTARAAGVQTADAEEVVQQVLVSVVKALAERPHDRSRAKFRTWLGVVSKNATISLLRKTRPDRGSDDSAQHKSLQQVEDRAGNEAIAKLEQDYKRQLFLSIASDVERQFAADTWQAFWLTTVEGQPIEEVATKLGKQAGSVYAARSRVMRKIREKVECWQPTQ